MKITFSSGLSFFLRLEYITKVAFDRLDIGEYFSDSEYEDLVDAGCAFSAEQEAMNYLSRAEHSRYMLKIKLIKKNHNKIAIDSALDYLEKKNYLSDERFAEAWLRNRLISHAEGRIKLTAGLANKGISREISKKVLDAFFSEISEAFLFKKAVDKCVRMGKSGDKLKKSLLRSGFSWKLVKTL